MASLAARQSELAAARANLVVVQADLVKVQADLVKVRGDLDDRTRRLEAALADWAVAVARPLRWALRHTATRLLARQKDPSSAR